MKIIMKFKKNKLSKWILYKSSSNLLRLSYQANQGKSFSSFIRKNQEKNMTHYDCFIKAPVSFYYSIKKKYFIFSVRFNEVFFMTEKDGFFIVSIDFAKLIESDKFLNLIYFNQLIFYCNEIYKEHENEEIERKEAVSKKID